MTRRKQPSVGVKLHAALLLLGFTDEEIAGGVEWDHDPRIELRDRDPVTGDTVPAQNDPHFIRPLRTADHKVKTFGTPATTAGSDIHQIAKAKRLTKAQQEFRARLLAKDRGEQKPKSRWGLRQFGRRTRPVERREDA